MLACYAPGGAASSGGVVFERGKPSPALVNPWFGEMVNEFNGVLFNLRLESASLASHL